MLHLSLPVSQMLRYYCSRFELDTHWTEQSKEYDAQNKKKDDRQSRRTFNATNVLYVNACLSFYSNTASVFESWLLFPSCERKDANKRTHSFDWYILVLPSRSFEKGFASRAKMMRRACLSSSSTFQSSSLCLLLSPPSILCHSLHLSHHSYSFRWKRFPVLFSSPSLFFRTIGFELNFGFTRFNSFFDVILLHPLLLSIFILNISQRRMSQFCCWHWQVSLYDFSSFFLWCSYSVLFLLFHMFFCSDQSSPRSSLLCMTSLLFIPFPADSNEA